MPRQRRLRGKELARQWRAYSLEQQTLLNCRQLWQRQVEKNRRDVEEAVEKLKVLAQLGALTAGFAVSAFYDFQYTASPSDPVIPFFGLVTALTVGFELNSCVLCTLMLSSVVKAGKRYTSEEEEAEYLWRLRDWAAAAAGGVPGSVPPAPRRSFARHWESRCESRWRTALAMFLAGIPTFFAVMGLAGYLKYWNSPATVVITAVLMAAAFVYTVGMTADWAKSLLGRRAAGGEDTMGWQGAWWTAPEPSQRLPFAFHQVPHKDVCWPPPSSQAAVATAASVASTAGDEHQEGERGVAAGAGAVSPAPYLARTLAELPYPAIVGLQPWPTELAVVGALPAAAGLAAGAGARGVVGQGMTAAIGRAPAASEAGTAPRAWAPGPPVWAQAAELRCEAVDDAGGPDVAAGAAAGAAAVTGIGAAAGAGSGGASAGAPEPLLGLHSHVSGGSYTGRSRGGMAFDTEALWPAYGYGDGGGGRDAAVDDDDRGAPTKAGSDTSAGCVQPDRGSWPRGPQQAAASAGTLQPQPAVVAGRQSLAQAEGRGSGGTAAPPADAAGSGVPRVTKALGRGACGGASKAGSSEAGGAGPGAGGCSSSVAGNGGGDNGPGKLLPVNGADVVSGAAGRGHGGSRAAPQPLEHLAGYDGADGLDAAPLWRADGADGAAQGSTDSLHSCDSMPENANGGRASV
ncbi:hypothetical protein HYH02_003582 [Chlamydomonas schloesseri]|uniref:Uncharacterized protein n=1 Tax=Chlamydomonas schloesseri TaxID=2026947 RepID=A0A836B9H7_9CHLO|nr:hypothetical protein HYH02_003582 [Chlamydomonas schloesseri]|eukprot:KAG2451806.1 hypothetical protein HYH02_003582 [Chlamydomonas schloesseri]